MKVNIGDLKFLGIAVCLPWFFAILVKGNNDLHIGVFTFLIIITAPIIFLFEPVRFTMKKGLAGYITNIGMVLSNIILPLLLIHSNNLDELLISLNIIIIFCWLFYMLSIYFNRGEE